MPFSFFYKGKFMIKYILSIIAIVAINIGTLFCYTKLVSIPKIAVVDISKIVEKSEKVKELRDDNNKKLDELEQWIEESRVKVQKEKDKTKKEQLIDQYQDIARQRENIIKHNYEAKLQEINDEISATIKKTAKNNECNVIILNNVIMEGGLDITDEVLKNLPM